MKLGTKTHLLCFVINTIGVFVAGWAVRDLWLWFLVPFGAPPLTLLVAAGIFQFLRMPSKDASPMLFLLVGVEREEEATQKQKRFYVMYQVTTDIIVPAMTWLCGYVLHCLSAS